MSIQQFKDKYGTEGWKLAIEAFITKAPEFEGDLRLAKIIGEICGDLEAALKELP